MYEWPAITQHLLLHVILYTALCHAPAHSGVNLSMYTE